MERPGQEDPGWRVQDRQLLLKSKGGLALDRRRGHAAPMDDLLTIGQLARAAGVPVSTVRYYERQRLLKPTRRSRSNYRQYSAEQVGRLRFIRAAQASGFGLDDVRELLRPSPCGRVQELIERRLQKVDARMQELRRVRRVLRESLRECREHEPTGRCAVVDGLSIRSQPTQPTP